MKRKAKWDDYIETPLKDFKYYVAASWVKYWLDRIRRGYESNIRPVLFDQRGTRLGKTMLDDPITLGGWDKKLRRKK